MATFVVAHGAWSAGFVWKRMHPLLRAAGHELFTPTHTGLGERLHLAHPEVDLEHHIADICAVIFHEDLHETMTQALTLARGETKLPRSFIYCTRVGPGDMFGPFARTAKADARWRYFEMDASHNPHVTAPEALAEILCIIAAGLA